MTAPEPIAVLVLDGQDRPVFTPAEIANLAARGAMRQSRCPSTHPALDGLPQVAPTRRTPEESARGLLAESAGPVVRRGETDADAAARWHRDAGDRAAARQLLADAGQLPPDEGSPRARPDLVQVQAPTPKTRKRSTR